MKINWKALIVFLFIMLFYSFALDKYPIVWVDEPWLAEPSWNFVKYGKFVNFTFSGWYNYDILEIPYFFYHYALALIFKIFGLGIVQARLISLISAFLTLIVVYETTKLLYENNKNTALLAAGILAINPIFFQCARQSRQEAIEAFFIALGFYFLIKGIKSQKSYYYFFCGVAASGAFLSHYNAAVACAALFLIMLFKERKAVLPYIAGIFVFILPYMFFIAANFFSFKEQMLTQCGDRIFFLPFMVENLAHEYIRWMHPSLIFSLVLNIGALSYLIITNYKNKKQDLLIDYIIIFYVLFTFIDSSRKPFLYLNLIFPFLAILCAVFFAEIYKNKEKLFFYILIFLTFAGGLLLPYKLIKYLPSDYYGIIHKIKDVIPQDAVVAGMPTYWFGIEEYYKYRSYDLIYYYAAKYKTSYKKAAKLMNARYIIFDDSWATSYMTARTEDFLQKDCILIKTITDKYYGQGYDGIERKDNIKIYRLK